MLSNMQKKILKLHTFYICETKATRQFGWVIVSPHLPDISTTPPWLVDQCYRWVCCLCITQNGFKCHLTSESHQRQLLLFAENPDEYIDGFSKWVGKNSNLSNFYRITAARISLKCRNINWNLQQKSKFNNLILLRSV